MHNATKLNTKALQELATQAARLFHTYSVALDVLYLRPGRRSDCRFLVPSSGGKNSGVLTLLVREQTPKKPYDEKFARAVAACIRAGTARIRGKRNAKLYWAALPWPDDQPCPLWKPLKAPEKLPIRVRNAERARKALERCERELSDCARRLQTLQKRRTKLKRRVAYYADVKEGPAFEAQVQQLVQEKFGADDSAPEENPAPVVLAPIDPKLFASQDSGNEESNAT